MLPKELENRLTKKLSLFSKDELIEIIIIYNENNNISDVLQFESDLNEYLIDKIFNN